jgi:hypothetical protein
MEWLLIAALNLTGVMVAQGECDNNVKGWQHENWIVLCDDDPKVLKHEAIHIIQHHLGREILPEKTLSSLVETLPEDEVFFVAIAYDEADFEAELEARILQNQPTLLIAFGVITSKYFGF